MTNDEDVVWGDNVIYAEFGKGPSGKRNASKPRGRTRGSSSPAVSSTIEKLLATQDWAGVFTSQRRGTSASATVDPRTTFSRWFWEFVIREADQGRIKRGEKYRANGNVLSTRLGNGYVLGEVQGTQPEPFSALIRLPQRGKDQIEEVLNWLVDNPSALSDFENGELPYEQMEKLICDGEEYLSCDCTCPDPAPVCKHVVAVAAELVSNIDRDPLSLLELRDYPQRELQRRLQQLTLLRSRSKPKRLGLGGVVRDGDDGDDGDSAQQSGAGDSEESSVENAAGLFAVEADYWGNDLQRVEVPTLEIIDPLKVTDRSLLHDALLPTCVISRETIRAVSDLEDCWSHLQQSLSLGQRER